MPPIRMLLVDDSADIVDAVRILASDAGDVEVVGSLLSADDLVDEIRRCRPQVVVVDLTMAGKSPLDAVREASSTCPGVRLVVFSGHDDPEMVHAALDAGAWGFVSKRGNLDAVLQAVRNVAGGQIVLPEQYRPTPTR